MANAAENEVGAEDIARAETWAKRQVTRQEKHDAVRLEHPCCYDEPERAKKFIEPEEAEDRLGCRSWLGGDERAAGHDCMSRSRQRGPIVPIAPCGWCSLLGRSL